MAFFLEPGHIAMVLLTPEQYHRMMDQQGPNLWPVYFGARFAANVIQDLAMKAIQVSRIDDLKANLDVMIGAGLDVAAEQAAAGPTGDVGALRDDIKRFYGGLYDNWKAGLWQGMGSAYSSAMDDFINTGQMVYAVKTLAYHIAITPRIRRHWNKTFTPAVPNASMAHILYHRGHYTYDQFQEHAAWDGWDTEGAELLEKAMELLPAPREAFYLWCKGHLTAEQRDALYFAGGYEPEWHPILTDNWMYTLSVYDLTRIADYVELDQIWALDVMKRHGVRESDRAKIWEMLEVRPLRDEIRNLTNKWLWRYKYGRATLTQLEGALDGLGVKSKEKEFLIEKAQLDYEDELIDEWIEILRWRFRTAQITQEDFLQGLLDLEICLEKANLIVEGEIAKGYYGYGT